MKDKSIILLFLIFILILVSCKEYVKFIELEYNYQEKYIIYNEQKYFYNKNWECESNKQLNKIAFYKGGKLGINKIYIYAENTDNPFYLVASNHVYFNENYKIPDYNTLTFTKIIVEKTDFNYNTINTKILLNKTFNFMLLEMVENIEPVIVPSYNMNSNILYTANFYLKKQNWLCQKFIIIKVNNIYYILKDDNDSMGYILKNDFINNIGLNIT